MTTDQIGRESWFSYAVTGGTTEISPSAPVLFRGDFYRSIDTAIQLGFDAIELHIRSAHDIEGEELKEYCQKRNFSISALATGMAYTADKLSLIDEEKEVRQNAIERLKEIIDVANKLECAVIIGYMRGNIPDLREYRKYEDYLMESLQQVVSHAEKRNVLVVLEAINKGEVNYLNAVRETTDFVKRMGSSFLKVHIDTFHMDLEEIDMAESIAYCGEHIGYVHYVDHNRRIPGEGHIDFFQVTEALRKTGYGGYLSLEYPPFGDAYQSAEAGLTYVKNIEQQCRINQQLPQE